MADEPKLRLGMSKEGDQILYLGSEMKVMKKIDVNNLIANLQTGEDNAQKIRDSLKIINGIFKEYNGIGKTIEPKLKTAEEAKENLDEAA